jgi:hypothetical protein
MLKVFKSFDKDNSGFIDINELADVAKDLGRTLDANELAESMRDLDVNKDNKISYEEFSQWWLSGRQGLSEWMRSLLSFKLKSLKFLDQISDQVKEVLESASTESAADISTSSLSVNINKV